MNFEFENKNIVITGGSKGIGLEIAKKIASLGSNVFIIARDKKALKNAQDEITRTHNQIICKTYSADVTDLKKVTLAIQAARNSFSKIDGLINNAGTAYPEYFENIPIAQFERLMQVDYMGSVYFTKGLIEYIQPHGFVSFTSSVVGYMGIFGYSAYAGPKFALIGLAECLRQELKSRQISVSVLCPPDTETPGYAEEQKTKPFETQKLSESAKLISAAAVADKYIKKLRKRKFIITVNFESALFYKINGAFPGVVRTMIDRMIRNAQKLKIKS